jgi:hypothetical protein
MLFLFKRIMFFDHWFLPLLCALLAVICTYAASTCVSSPSVAVSVVGGHQVKQGGLVMLEAWAIVGPCSGDDLCFHRWMSVCVALIFVAFMAIWLSRCGCVLFDVRWVVVHHVF